ncbi:hypothetical protein EYC80_004427 [Monilinia laxa]|uniref:Uncharacterized protein n=1 Tax=Monilinia laxa TaxID=61186 RepID=A0A5N6KN74_MONLA|nr:hypothetical protein EYC80_004427 [Monilinia laxa]
MDANLAYVWGELLRSTSDNELALRDLLEGRPEIEKARDVNYIFMNYLSIIRNISTIKMGGGLIDTRVRMPSDLEFIEMLKLLVRYTSDITSWVEDHDRSGAPWVYIEEFYGESLHEVDTQCQRWWALANMTMLNQRPGPFAMHQSLPPIQGPSQFHTTEAPQNLELSFTENQSPSATASFNDHQTGNKFPPIWNDVAEPGFVSPQNFTAPHRSNHRSLNNGRNEAGELFERYPTTPVPSTPRLEQQGFAPSPNPSLAIPTSANKHNGFYQAMPTPARKIAIPRLQKLGAFEPLFPPTQNSVLGPFQTISHPSSSSSTKKRQYAKASAETLIARQPKRQAVGSEIPHWNPVSNEHEAFTFGSEYAPGTLSNGPHGSAPASHGDFHNASESILPGSSLVNSNTAILRTKTNDTSSSVLNSNQADIHSHTHWNDAFSATVNSNQSAEYVSLGISSPQMNPSFSHFEGLGMDMNMGYAGVGINIQNARPFDSFMQSSPLIGNNSYG